MNMFRKSIIPFNNDLYTVEYRFKEHEVKPEKVDDFKQFLECNIVLKKDGHLYFCSKIDDAQIEEIVKSEEDQTPNI